MTKPVNKLTYCFKIASNSRIFYGLYQFYIIAVHPKTPGPD